MSELVSESKRVRTVSGLFFPSIVYISSDLSNTGAQLGGRWGRASPPAFQTLA